MFTPWGYATNGDVLYKKHIEFFGPFTWIEQTIGIGFKVDIAGSFFITERAGVGVSFMLGDDIKLPQMLPKKYEWEFGFLCSAGIGYRFHWKR